MTEPTKVILARNVRGLMDHHGWSEHDLAKRSGVSQKAINNLLNVKSAPTLDTIDMLAAAFEMRLCELVSARLWERKSEERMLREMVFSPDIELKRKLLDQAGGYYEERRAKLASMTHEKFRQHIGGLELNATYSELADAVFVAGVRLDALDKIIHDLRRN